MDILADEVATTAVEDLLEAAARELEDAERPTAVAKEEEEVEALLRSSMRALAGDELDEEEEEPPLLLLLFPITKPKLVVVDGEGVEWTTAALREPHPSLP